MLEGQGPPAVTDLSTSFAVEGCACEHQFDALPRVRLFDFTTIHNDGDQWAGDLGALVAHNGRRPGTSQHPLIHGCHLHLS